MLICPVCRQAAVVRHEVPLEAVRNEIRMRRDFVFARLARNAPRAELKDLTDFMHGFPTPLATCARCGTMLRRETNLREAHSYEEDPNDRDLMHQLLPRYVTAFRNKEVAYRSMLRPGAAVLELGSHLGAFLQVAEEWGWRPFALDVGRDTAEFASASGFDVRRQLVEESNLPAAAFDAVFLWNCFDQIPDPDLTLAGVYRVLKPNGLVVVRVPNATFYRVFRTQLRSDEPDAFVVQALAYNNLLGFPYLYGYTAESLNCLLLRNGFETVCGFNSELVTMPFAELTAHIETEQEAMSQAVERWTRESTSGSGRLTGPWIELVYMKMTESDWKDRMNLRRSAPVVPLRRRNIDHHFLERAA